MNKETINTNSNTEQNNCNMPPCLTQHRGSSGISKLREKILIFRHREIYTYFENEEERRKLIITKEKRGRYIKKYSKKEENSKEK